MRPLRPAVDVAFALLVIVPALLRCRVHVGSLKGGCVLQVKVLVVIFMVFEYTVVLALLRVVIDVVITVTFEGVIVDVLVIVVDGSVVV